MASRWRRLRFSKISKYIFLVGLILIAASSVLAYADYPATETAGISTDTSANYSELPWWGWTLILFVVTFLIGIVSVLGGVGGGVLFVPIVSGFFPFHLDFVRGAGLLVALTGSLAAGPFLLKKGMADLRLSMPLALMASAGAIGGAMLGLALPGNIVQIGLGVTIVAIALIMLKARNSEYPQVKRPDALSAALQISGIYHEESKGENIIWQVHRTPQSLAVFVVIGVMAGMFGLGAGWANVPVLNLMMGVPLKVAVSTSKFLLSITDTSAAWIYINKGAVLPIIVAPSVIGMMLGARIGVALLTRTRPSVIRYIIIALLFLAGLRALLKGCGV